MEVRCCCQPTKLLGWLMVDSEVKVGERVVFRMPMGLERGDLVRDRVVVLPVDALMPSGELALKSDDVPLERLRLVRGFVEASSTEPTMMVARMVDSVVRTAVHFQGPSADTPVFRQMMRDIIERRYLPNGMLQPHHLQAPPAGIVGGKVS